jgi:DNA (cytosine-5)-methyltransferase 1
MTTIYATAIGENSKGTGRLWLQGEKLLRGQFAPATTYRRAFKDGALIMIADPNGQYVVSGRKKHDRVEPVIDVCNKDIEKHFPIGTKLNAVVRKGKIIIRRAINAVKKAQRKNRLTRKVAAGAALSMVSVFHGIGLMDRAIHDGFAAEGVPVRASVVAELENSYLEASMRANAKMFDESTVFFSGPVQDFELGKVVHADIFCAGIPCTGASLAGRSKLGTKSAEEHPDAGTMFFTTLEWIKKFNYPDLVVLENVKAYASTISMSVIRLMLGNWGYDIHEMTLKGHDFGALENRERMVVVAVQKDLAEEGFDPRSILPVETKPATIADSLEPIAEDDKRWDTYGYLVEKQERDIAAGKGFRMAMLTPESESVPVLVRNYAKIQSTGAFLQHPTKPGYMRLFTEIEHGRFKGAPEGFVESLGVSRTTAHQGLGQSVIYPVFKAVGSALGRFVQRLASQANHPQLTLVA